MSLVKRLGFKREALPLYRVELYAYQIIMGTHGHLALHPLGDQS